MSVGMGSNVGDTGQSGGEGELGLGRVAGSTILPETSMLGAAGL